MSDSGRPLRDCLGRFPTGVTVVTYRIAGEDRGLTVNSFTAVSLDPPLVLVCLDRRTRASQGIEGLPFVVNVLASRQYGVALHFAGRPQTDAPVLWCDPPEGGPPRLADCAAYLNCQPWRVFDGGDHVIVLGEVASFEIRSEEPLVFYKGKFRGMGSPVEGTPWLSSLDYPFGMSSFASPASW